VVQDFFSINGMAGSCHFLQISWQPPSEIHECPDDDDNLGQALLQSGDFHPEGFEGWIIKNLQA